jgi:excisionase family DNA binding protein
MEWMTLNEAAAYLKIKPRTLAQWVREGKVPGHRLSGTQRVVWRFLQSELDAMLTSATEDDGRGRSKS